MLRSIHFRRNFFLILTADTLLLSLSFYIAHLVRFEFEIPNGYSTMYRQTLPLVLAFKLGVFYVFDLYRGMWRYTSVADLINIIKASTASTLLIVALLLFSNRFSGFSRAIFLIDWAVTILLIAGFRLGVRQFYEVNEKGVSLRTALRSFFVPLHQRLPGSKNLLIIGAGNCGEKIYREIRDNAQLRFNVVGFLDDAVGKIGMTIHGIPVLGSVDEIVHIIKKLAVDEALIAIPSATSSQMRRIVDKCDESSVEYKTIPSYGELIDGRVTLNLIREVAYRDLIGRDPIKLDMEKIGAYLHHQTILVSGAGGSIGAELCRQICRFNPKRLVLYERAESPLYEIDLELRTHFNGIDIVSILGDIRDQNQLIRTFDSYRPDTVFHAAAYKHVPMLEIQPWKAIENNILGTAALVKAAKQFDINRFVFVSTDKAVRPTNVMGATKRVSEMLIQSQNSDHSCAMRFAIVRFGNVVGSVGSVVPLFKKQIAAGGPVTVTHPEVTRYFMTIPEACQLILQAGALGADSCAEIYLLDMGTPIKIVDMARDLIRLSGFEPEEDIKIEFIGMRPGEKLYEELITDDENVVPTTHEKIMTLRGQEVQPAELNGKIDELVRLAGEQDGPGIRSKLQEIVPEYRPAENTN